MQIGNGSEAVFGQISRFSSVEYSFAKIVLGPIGATGFGVGY